MAVFSFTSSCVYVPFNNASASLIPCCSASKLSFVYPSEEIAFAILMTSFSSDISTVTFWRFALAASTSDALSFISDVQVASSGFFKSSVALFTTSWSAVQLSVVYSCSFRPSQSFNSSSSLLLSTVSFFSFRIVSAPTSTQPLLSCACGLFPTRSNWIVYEPSANSFCISSVPSTRFCAYVSISSW